ncbi:hypothetical protein KEM48_006306 [Puccinia striiformis f. sp. tritici PST-130]|nr:hypothetical protein KEM48_006306 [Puccinia striiformis f. sp. tritici PST-130]
MEERIEDVEDQIENADQASNNVLQRVKDKVKTLMSLIAEGTAKAIAKLMQLISKSSKAKAEEVKENLRNLIDNEIENRPFRQQPTPDLQQSKLDQLESGATSSSSYALPLPHHLPPPPPPPDQPTALHQPRWLPIVNDHPIDHPAHLLPLEIRLMMTSPSLTLAKWKQGIEDKNKTQKKLKRKVIVLEDDEE